MWLLRQHPQGTLGMSTVSHKLCEVVHGGDETLPLACLIGGHGLGWGLHWGFGVAWGVHLHQGQAGI